MQRTRQSKSVIHFDNFLLHYTNKICRNIAHIHSEDQEQLRTGTIYCEQIQFNTRLIPQECRVSRAAQCLVLTYEGDVGGGLSQLVGGSAGVVAVLVLLYRDHAQGRVCELISCCEL